MLLFKKDFTEKVIMWTLTKKNNKHNDFQYQSNPVTKVETKKVIVLNNEFSDEELLTENVLTNTASERKNSNLKKRKKVIECDKIYLKDGQVVEARGVTVVNNELRYYLCKDQNSPMFIISMNEVSSIQYASGGNYKNQDDQLSKGNNLNIQPTTFSNNSGNTYQKPTSKKDTGIGWNLASIFLGIFGAIMLVMFLFFPPMAVPAVIFGALAIIFGAIGIGRKGMGAGITGMIFGLITLIVGILLIALFL